MISQDFSKNNLLQEEDIPKNFDPKVIELRCLSLWKKAEFFMKNNSPNNKNSGEPCFIQFPPPNITGCLHMGHALNQTIMDSLARYNRMSGKDVLFLPGVDHAGIATQLVVERMMDTEKKSRYELGRDKFLKKIWEWKAQSSQDITKQVRRLGTSVDWSKEYFTMDKQTSKGVIEAFVRLHEQGLIYRGKKLVNWDPMLCTAISDLEVKLDESKAKMFYILYSFSKKNSKNFSTLGNIEKIDGLVIATTRPETIFADSAICVHPDDSRYQSFIGKVVKIPLCEREIPVIADNFVNPELGTGCVKITGAHNFEDYACSLRHNLPMITIFSLDGKLNKNVPEEFFGLKLDQARERVISELQKFKSLVKIQEHKIMQPRGDRSGAVLEPMLTDQWFMSMKKPSPKDSLNPGKSISEMAIEVVENGSIEFCPKNWKNLYKKWLDNIEDWCISRQLWWGHQIPAWHANNGQIFVAHNEVDALQKAKNLGISESLKQDPDVLDTWFSSSILPITTLGWPEKTIEIERYLSSGFLVSGFDIIFFWIARMIMMSLHLTGRIPFKKVYIHGLVRDSKGRKMSKSKGNTLDPLDLIEGINLENLIQKQTTNLLNSEEIENIRKYTRLQYPNGIAEFGTDALRLTMASYTTPGNNVNFDLKRCQNYRNFCNKIWNASRFVLMHAKKLEFIRNKEKIKLSFVDQWIISRLEAMKARFKDNFLNCRLDNIVEALYSFMWRDYCDWYLELSKIQIRNGSIEEKSGTLKTLIEILESFLRLAHPIIPFITEEIWQSISRCMRKIDHIGSIVTITSQSYPAYNPGLINESAEILVSDLKNQIECIRTLCMENNLPKDQKISLIAYGDINVLQRNIPYILSATKVDRIDIAKELPDIDAPTTQTIGSVRFILNTRIDSIAKNFRLNKYIVQLGNQIQKSQKKLQNPSFVKNAPGSIVEKEKNKLDRLIGKLKEITEKHENVKNVQES